MATEAARVASPAIVNRRRGVIEGRRITAVIVRMQQIRRTILFPETGWGDTRKWQATQIGGEDMNCKVYGMLAAAPVDFPNEVELRVYPHDKETGLASGGFYPYLEHRTWDWVRSRVPLVEYAWAGIEQKLEDGICAALGLGEYSVDLPDGAESPGIIQEKAPKRGMV